MHTYDAIKTKALFSVLKPDTEYFLRRIYRWYSKTFHTPLQEVFDIPVEFILKEYFEEYFENMEEDDRDEQLVLLTESEEARKRRLESQDYEDAGEHELMEMSRKQNEEKLKEKTKQINKLAHPKLPAQLDKLTGDIKRMAEQIKEEMQTDPPELPPEIDMKFEDDETFEKLLNGDSNINSVTDIEKP